MLSLEQLHNRLAQWGRWYRCREPDIVKLADAVVRVTYQEQTCSIGPNIPARLRQDFNWLPPERSNATDFPPEAAEIEAAVIDCGRYYRLASVVLRWAYCWHVPMNDRLELLGKLAPNLIDRYEGALRQGKLRMTRWHEAKAQGEAFVLARLDQAKRRAA